MQAQNRTWFGDKLWYLLNLPPELAREVFNDYSPETLRSKRKIYRKKIREGVEQAPQRPRDYSINEDAAQIRERLLNKKVEKDDAKESLIDLETRKYLHELLDETLDKTEIDPENIQRFRMTTGTHEGYIKNAEGKLEYTRKLRRGGISFVVEPKKFEPKWNPIHQPLADVHPIKMTSAKKRKGEIKTCVILPDPQIGYRKFVDGKTDPFHDEKALSIALQVLADVQPDKVVCLGDFLDLPAFGKYEQTEDYAHTTQLAIDYGHTLLATIRATLPKAEIVVIEGNHDRRIEKSIRLNSMYAYGIRRADDVTGWPVFSLPYLLAFDKLNIKYIEGYPAGKYWINENLQCIHGNIVRQPGATAAAVVKAETVSTIFGHIHRIETAYDTQNVFGGARANLAHSPGTLCRIDGGVPSYKGSTGLNGRPIISYENWQQGLAIVDYEDGNKPFSLHSVYINTFQDYKTTVNGKVYIPKKIF